MRRKWPISPSWRRPLTGLLRSETAVSHRGMDVHILRRLPRLKHSSSRGTEGYGPLKSRQPPHEPPADRPVGYVWCGAKSVPGRESATGEDEKEASLSIVTDPATESGPTTGTVLREGAFGNATGLVCRECGHQIALGPHYACPECFGPLEIAYDFPAVTREEIEAGPSNIWRYKALLPVPDDIEQSPEHGARLHPAAQGAQPRPRARHRRTSGSRTTRPTRPTPSRTASSPAR